MTSADCINQEEQHHQMEFVHRLSKKTRSNQSIEDSRKIDGDQKQQQHLQPQPNTPNTPTISKRHSLSSIFFRGKQPLSRISQEANNSPKKMKVEEKKGYFERRKERKLQKIEQKPVYKWNYKSLYKWLKYKGFDKKYIRLLKKDRLNGYIMLTLEISDLESLDIPTEMAKHILNTLIETSEKQDDLVDANCEVEVELPLQPVRSTMVFPND